MKDLRRELRRGTLELVLLHLLADEPTYGYELVRRLKARGGADFEVQEGTLYPILYRLEEAGSIEPEWTQPAAGGGKARGVPRKIYRLSSAGAARLEELTSAWRAFADGVEAILTASAPRSGENQREETR